MQLPRSQSMQFPRPKIYLSHLNQLIDKRVVIQPEIEINNKLFPQRDFARRLSTSHQRTKSSIQLRAQKFDVHWTKRNKNAQPEAKTASKQMIQQLVLDLPKTKSTVLPSCASPFQKQENAKFHSTYSSLPRENSNQGQNLASSCSSPHKNFLRRGSNIQKQIVINLMRHKLLREREFRQKKEYSNNEIIKMIQVFKGVAIEETTKKGFIVSDVRQRRGESRRELQRQIKGWQEPAEDFQQMMELNCEENMGKVYN